MYKTVVRPVTLFGSECWPATSVAEDKLSVAEMKMLRMSDGITRWDRQRNVDVRLRMGVVPIKDKVPEDRLRWYDHVQRARGLGGRHCS